MKMNQTGETWGSNHKGAATFKGESLYFKKFKGKFKEEVRELQIVLKKMIITEPSQPSHYTDMKTKAQKN